MATINFATREITSKIVYFGASGAGCNTNVERLWGLVETVRRSPLHRFGFKDSEERSWYFDYMPSQDSPLEGFTVCWQVYSLPGGVDVAAHREEVITDTDALVFVADARADRNQANLDHLLSLESLLASLGMDLESVPVVIQVNHTDDPNAREASKVVVDLNPFGFPVVQAVAKRGDGVVETHTAVASSVLGRIQSTLAGDDTIQLTAVHAQAETDADVIQRHVANIQMRSQESATTIDEIASEEGLPPVSHDDDSIEVAFQPREFMGSHPVRVLGATLEGDRVRVDLEMVRMGGGQARQLTVMLANRPTDTPPIPRSSPPQVVSVAPAGDRAFDYLPDESSVELYQETPDDLPGVWYGVMGIAGGIVIGLLTGYLVGVVL